MAFSAGEQLPILDLDDSPENIERWRTVCHEVGFFYVRGVVDETIPEKAGPVLDHINVTETTTHSVLSGV